MGNTKWRSDSSRTVAERTRMETTKPGKIGFFFIKEHSGMDTLRHQEKCTFRMTTYTTKLSNNLREPKEKPQISKLDLFIYERQHNICIGWSIKSWMNLHQSNFLTISRIWIIHYNFGAVKIKIETINVSYLSNFKMNHARTCLSLPLPF